MQILQTIMKVEDCLVKLVFRQASTLLKPKTSQLPLINPIYSFHRKRRQSKANNVGSSMCEVIFCSANKFTNILVGESCVTENAPCDDFPHSVCLQGACQCRRGYYLKNELCKAGK